MLGVLFADVQNLSFLNSDMGFSEPARAWAMGTGEGAVPCPVGDASWHAGVGVALSA